MVCHSVLKVPEGDKKGWGQKSVQRNSFPNLAKKINLQIQEGRDWVIPW